MTSPTGMMKNIKTKVSLGRHGFTLVELILVMVLITTISALVIPSMSNSFRARQLSDTAKKFYSLTEYARDEAISSGVPMSIWIEPDTGQYGLKPKDGYASLGGRSVRFTLPENIKFSQVKQPSTKGAVSVIEFNASGLLDAESADAVRFTDGKNQTVSIAKNSTSWGYSITNENTEETKGAL